MLPREENFWYGSTTTTTEAPFFHSKYHNTFVSIEPIHENFSMPYYTYDGIDWVIFGVETGNRKEKIIPEKSWIEPLVCSLKEKNIPIFMKDSLAGIWNESLIIEFPWKEKCK